MKQSLFKRVHFPPVFLIIEDILGGPMLEGNLFMQMYFWIERRKKREVCVTCQNESFNSKLF